MNMRMRAANNFVVAKPVLINWAKDTQKVHVVVRIKDVVNDSLKTKRVICIWHYVILVPFDQMEVVRELRRIFVAVECLKACLVTEFFKIDMITGHGT